MSKNTLIIATCLLLIFGAMTRLMPHEPNMTALTALAVISSLYLNKRLAIMLPVVVLLLSDGIIGFYDWRLMLSVYGAFALIGILSWWLRGHRSLVPVGLSLIGSSLLFFFITNTAVWYFSPWYEQSFAGLMYAYELGLPFLRNMFLGDVFYTTILVCACEISIALARYARHTFLTKAHKIQAASFE